MSRSPFNLRHLSRDERRAQRIKSSVEFDAGSASDVAAWEGDFFGATSAPEVLPVLGDADAIALDALLEKHGARKLLMALSQACESRGGNVFDLGGDFSDAVDQDKWSARAMKIASFARGVE